MLALIKALSWKQVAAGSPRSRRSSSSETTRDARGGNLALAEFLLERGSEPDHCPWEAVQTWTFGTVAA